jgi:Predicted membrane protein (DUF2142)
MSRHTPGGTRAKGTSAQHKKKRESVTAPIRGNRSSQRQAPTRPLRARTAARLGGVLAGIPSAAWVCALVGCLSAVSWSLISPPFEIPDEPSHYAYVQHLAETGHPPTGNGAIFSSAEGYALLDLHSSVVRENPQNGTISTLGEQQKLEQDMATHTSTASENASVATTEPPLYYALEAIPYLATGGNVLDRLTSMRLLSALLAGVTSLFAFLFVRETLPGVSWAWIVGGLSVALYPLLGEMSGAVNPDALLYAVATALFFCLARAFRLGLTPARASAIGAVVAIGLLSKLNFVGMIPGAAVGLLVLTLRARRRSPASAVRSLALGLGVAASPVIAYVALGSVLHHGGGTNPIAVGSEFLRRQGSLFTKISYIWELFLPQLPGMPSLFHGVSTTRQLWFDGLVGRYGWLDTFFPGWIYTVALIPAALIATLCARELARHRTMLRARTGELATYAAIGVGIAVQVGASDYLYYPNEIGVFTEPRYLLPLIALFGAALALAARGAGRRWGTAVGTMLILLLLGHDIFSQLLVIGRYYG